MPPGRSRRGRSSASVMTVLSTPTPHAPPSSTAAIFPSMSRMTCAAVVVEGRPEVFAEGAASGTPLSRMSARAIGCDGRRMPTVSRPHETSSGMQPPLGTIMVIGPGQNASASCFACGGTLGHRS